MKIGKTLAVLAILCGTYYLTSPSIENFLLKRNGACIRGVLTSEIIRIRYHQGEMEYRVMIDGKSYLGNSLESDKNKVGDSVCIVYLESRPSVNRALKYFEDTKPICSCASFNINITKNLGF
jgi:hypothetical protein